MKVRNICLPLEILARNGLVAKIRCSESFKYIEGKRTGDGDGNIRVELMFPDNECDTLAVKVPKTGVPKSVMEAPPLTPLKFTGFEARLWTSPSGTTMVTAKAVGVDIDDTINY